MVSICYIEKTISSGGTAKTYRYDGGVADQLRFLDCTPVESLVAGGADPQASLLRAALGSSANEDRLYECLASFSDIGKNVYITNSLLRDLWRETNGLGSYPLLDLLAENEANREYYHRYRDHFVHQVRVWILGLYLIGRVERIRRALMDEARLDYDRRREAPNDSILLQEVLRRWKIAALWHDIGYVFEVQDSAHSKGLMKAAFDEINGMLQFPLAYSLGDRLTRSDERAIRTAANEKGFFLPFCVPLENMRDLCSNGGWAILNGIGGATGLSESANGMEQYFRLCSQGDFRDGVSRNGFYDHGIAGAILLLRLHSFIGDSFRRTEELLGKCPELAGRVSELKRKAICDFARDCAAAGEAVVSAARAISLHNVEPSLIESRAAEDAGLTPSKFRIALESQPLAYLLSLSDGLQGWDRPRRDAARTPADLGLTSHELWITADCEKVYIHINDPDEGANHRACDDMVESLGSRLSDILPRAEGILRTGISPAALDGSSAALSSPSPPLSTMAGGSAPTTGSGASILFDRDFYDWPLEILDDSKVNRNRIALRKLREFREQAKTSVIAMYAATGFGKSTTAKQFLDETTTARKFAIQIQEQNPQAALRELGEWLGVQGENDPLTTNIAHRIFHALGSKDTILVLDSFQYMQERDGRITDGFIKQLLSLFLSNSTEQRILAILCTTRKIEGLASATGRLREIIPADFVLTEKEGLDLLAQRNITGAPDTLRRLLSDCDYNPGEIALIPPGLRNAVNAMPAPGGNLKDRFMEDLYQGMGKMARKLYFFLCLINRNVKVDHLESLLGDEDSPLRISRDERTSALDRLRDDGLIGVQENAVSVVNLYKRCFFDRLHAEFRREAGSIYEFLYDFYKSRFDRERRPDDIDPLYDAVRYGCRAGKLDESLDLFWNDICRGREFHSQAKGFYQRDLACLSEFFPDGDRGPPHGQLSWDAREWLPSICSYLRKNLGDVVGAIEIRKAQIARVDALTGRKVSDRAPTYLLASIDASRLMQALVLNGQLDAAKRYYKKAIEFAELGRRQTGASRFGNTLTYDYVMMMAEGKMGAVCYFLGEDDDALLHFKMADEDFGSRLDGIDDVLYCETLMARTGREGDNAIDEAKRRADEGLEAARQKENSEKMGYYYYLEALIAERREDEGSAVIQYFDRAISLSTQTNRTDMMTLSLIGKLLYLTKPKCSMPTGYYLDANVDEDIRTAWNYARCFELNLYFSDIEAIELRRAAPRMDVRSLEAAVSDLELRIMGRKHLRALAGLNELRDAYLGKEARP
jgi:hypothetical protein